MNAPPGPELNAATRILLVDPQSETLLALETALGTLGEPMLRARSGAEAVAKVRDTDFAAILLGPQISGTERFETARLIREHERSGPTPILFLTSTGADPEFEVRGYALGAVDFLRQPTAPEVLRAKVELLVGAFKRGQRAAGAAVEKLRLREAELSDFLENAAVGLHWVGEDGKILWANAAELELLGYSRDEYVGRHIAEFHADPDTIRDILQRLAGNETLHSYEARLRCKDGSVRHVLITSNVLWDGDRFVHTRCLTRDVTERVRAQALLQAREAELRAIIDATPVYITYSDAECRFRLVNRRFEEWSGHSRESLRGRAMADVLGPENWRALEPYVAAVLSGKSVSFESAFDTGKGETRWFHVTYAPHCNDSGELEGFVSLVQDIQARRQMEEARQFVVEASDLLASSLDYRATLERLTHLAVPRMADWCAVDMLDRDGATRRLAVAHVDPAKVALAYELERRYPTDPAAAHGLPHVLRTGEALFLPIIPDSLLVEAARDEEHLRIVRELGLVSGMVVPLVARGRTLGAITLATAESGRTYTPEDLALAQDLARRAAIAVDNASLYEAAQQEIAERSVLERQLRASEEEFRSLVEQAPLSVQVLAPTGETLQVNPAWERLWGVTLEQLHSLNYNILQDPQLTAKGLMPYIRRAFAGEATVVPPVDYDRAETLPGMISDPQTKRWVRANIYPVFGDNGALQKVVLVHEDYTDRKLLEDELQKQVEALAESARHKDQFLAMLAHELRNPIGVISNAVAVLDQSGAPEERSGKHLATIARQVRHLARMVDDLLDVSRLTRGLVELKKQQVLLADLVSQSVESCQIAVASRKHELIVTLPEQPVLLDADPARLEQVLCNILNNAAKYTDPGGKIWLTGRVEGEDPPWLVLRVRDTGIGMSPQLLPHVFDLFTQADQSLDRSQGGLGIGLTLVRALVEMHGGSVSAHSGGIGAGSEFVIRIPALAGQPQPSAPVAAPRDSAQAARRRVLVVDDSVDAAETLVDLLNGCGHEAVAVNSGAAALALVPSFQPEAVVCDIGMPGMNGYETARQLRSLPGADELLLIALTGYGQEADQWEAREAGFDLHLTKPAEPRLLLDALSRGPAQ